MRTMKTPWTPRASSIRGKSLPSGPRPHGVALTLAAMVAGLAAPASAASPAREHLQVHGRRIVVRDVTALTLTASPGLRLTGPHSFTKPEDNGYRFEVSLASLVAPVRSCADPDAIAVALEALRTRIKVTRATPEPAT